MTTATSRYYDWVDPFVPRRMHGSVTHGDVKDEKKDAEPVKAPKKKSDLKSKSDKNVSDVGVKTKRWGWTLDSVEQLLDDDFE